MFIFATDKNRNFTPYYKIIQHEKIGVLLDAPVVLRFGQPGAV